MPCLVSLVNVCTFWMPWLFPLDMGRPTGHHRVLGPLIGHLYCISTSEDLVIVKLCCLLVLLLVHFSRVVLFLMILQSEISILS